MDNVSQWIFVSTSFPYLLTWLIVTLILIKEGIIWYEAILLGWLWPIQITGLIIEQILESQ